MPATSELCGASICLTIFSVVRWKRPPRQLRLRWTGISWYRAGA